MNSITEFALRAIEEFEVESAAIQVSRQPGSQADRLTEHLISVLRGASVPLRPVSYQSLFSAVAFPALQTLKELRSAMLAIWPSLENSQAKVFTIDSAAIGLFAQVQSLLDINLEPS
ncbi:MAG: hypothetical protein JWO13_429 [Acidobacteriales bacterium]|nr:hypothetical protein [Terriglobales bacterium]